MTKTTIETRAGVLAGTADATARRFLGIPYAAPPVGPRRFALPEPAEAWSGVRDATALGATAAQSPYAGAIGLLLPSMRIDGDDVLTLNVWAPDDADGAPVMIWIHGGALERGAAALPAYDGTSFARDGVVFVSINYRLGAEGFSVFEDAPQNVGLADAAAAVHWVHENIAAFGGDPAHITLFGESAGGALVAALLTRPDMRAFVAGGIVQSGPLDAATPERAGRVTRAVARELRISPTAAAFRQVPPAELVAARDTLAAGGTLLRSSPGYTMSVDGAQLPASPRTGLRDLGIPLLIGTNTDEYRLWYTPEQLAKISRLTFGLASLGMRLPRGLWRAYRADVPEGGAGELLGQVLTDNILRAPAVELARQRAAATHVYEFAWPSPIRDLRAAHALEIGFVFDGLRDGAADTMAGPTAPVSLAAQMHADWVAFARDGRAPWAAFRDGGLVRRYDAVTDDVALPRASALAALNPLTR